VRGRKNLRAVLQADDHLSTCAGSRCLVNPPEKTPTLAYGRTVTLRPFRCTSPTKGVRCVAIRSGHGFPISRAGSARL
jgi:hypothetical protein